MSKENINLSTDLGKVKLGNLYLAWFGNTYDNVFEITGKAVNVDWFDYNLTNSSDS